MKKILLGLLLAGAAMGANAQKNNTVIIKGILNGDLKEYNKMYMYTRMGTDSAEIKNGAYTFSFPFEEIAFKNFLPEYVRAWRMMYQPFGILITEPGTYYITSDIAKGMYASSEVKGPEATILYRQFEKDNNNASKKVNSSLAALYGDEWYRINENDARYANLQSSRDSLNVAFVMPVIENLIKQHPNSIVSAYATGFSREIGTMEQREHLLSLLSPEMRQSEPAKKFADFLEGLKNSGVGNTVANFTLPDPNGKDVVFSSLKGKYVLIDFWASWCSPCRRSFPHMREIYKKYKSDQFEIYSISIDQNKNEWLKAVADEKNPWLQSLDDKNISQKGFAVTGVPTTFLIDPNGKIMVKEVGFDENGNGEIEKKIKSLFGDKNISNANTKTGPIMKLKPVN